MAIQNAPTQQAQQLQADNESVAGTELIVHVERSSVWPPTSLNLKAMRSVEQAVQNAPTEHVQRPWPDVPSVAGTELEVRVEGSFVWPPTSLDLKAVRSVVFLAGGVGVM